MNQRFFQSKHNQINFNIQKIEKLLNNNNCNQYYDVIVKKILWPDRLGMRSRNERELEMYNNSESMLDGLQSLNEVKILNNENCLMIFNENHYVPSYLSILSELNVAKPSLLTQTNLNILANLYNSNKIKNPSFFWHFNKKIIILSNLGLLNTNTINHLIQGHYSELIKICDQEQLNIEKTEMTRDEALQKIKEVVVPYLDKYDKVEDINSETNIDNKIELCDSANQLLSKPKNDTALTNARIQSWSNFYTKDVSPENTSYTSSHRVRFK